MPVAASTAPAAPTASGPDAAARMHQAARALEALVLKQLVTTSKAFTGGEGAGSAIRADLFADALADAMVQGGGIGLARQIEASLSPGGRSPGPTTAPGGAPSLLVPPGAAPAPGRPPTAATLPAVTSPFGARQDPFDGHLTRHGGVDLAGAEGAAVRAVAGGVVRRAGARGGYGQAVEIDHGGGLTTLYAHASDLMVEEGQHVAPGQPIARVGHSGRATGPHLHFEVRVSGTAVDPARALKIYGLRAEDMISGS